MREKRKERKTKLRCVFAGQGDELDKLAKIGRAWPAATFVVGNSFAPVSIKQLHSLPISLGHLQPPRNLEAKYLSCLRENEQNDKVTRISTGYHS